jgi:hypothetical protein
LILTSLTPHLPNPASPEPRFQRFQKFQRFQGLVLGLSVAVVGFDSRGEMTPNLELTPGT